MRSWIEFERRMRLAGRGWPVCLLAVVVSQLMVGCHLGVPVPAGWVAVADVTQDSVDGGVAVASGSNQSDQDTGLSKGGGGVLQVIVCYGAFFSNHTALRLTCPGRADVFWDPGGTYGEDDLAMGRRRDLILGRGLTIERWWAYRRDGCNEPIMAVYEWDVTNGLAVRLRGVLVEGVDPVDPTVGFYCDAGAWMCCVSICEFLDRFTGGLVVVPKRWVLPLNLGRHLWTQGPSRVRIFRVGRGSTVYVNDPLADVRGSLRTLHVD